ncbi:ATP-binding protein [Kineosporia sp. J2-2]|uniref:ATP-binding protein n=1 Tax=Kineosporia corallincola TaxID=2835133 RepID=A0ABS5TDX3_9ACTN|nr:ATP-binding protein [Kineosporia corallincola]MBT0769277.1 ATP-binding protein [Kineosporia corallincola]
MSRRTEPTVTPLLTWVLEPGDPQRVPVVRRQVITALRATCTGDLDAAELVVAELLNNAVAHTSGPARVTLSWAGPRPRLAVSDGGPGFGHRPDLLGPHGRLVPRLPDDLLSERGRGLYLVARLAHDLVVNPRPDGGCVVSVTPALLTAPASPDGTTPAGEPSGRSPGR